jgi:cytochrome c oxidase subunit 3
MTKQFKKPELKLLPWYHPYHLVESSPWPFMVSILTLFFTSNFTLYMHYYLNYLEWTYISFLLLLFIIYNWLRDVVTESTFEGHHTFKVQQSLGCGMVLFIVSETMFFFSFFWVFIYSSIAPSPEIGWWPPKGIDLLDPYGVPLLNTAVLLSSGVSVTFAHRSIRGGFRNLFLNGLGFTVFLGIFFTGLQGIEYWSANFLIIDSIYGSLFYLCTGFHGFHVIVGSIFLAVCFLRQMFYHFALDHHLGFEFAAWYWHFVDIVWLFLYGMVYYYSMNTSVFSINYEVYWKSLFRNNIELWVWLPEIFLLFFIIFTFSIILFKYEKYTRSIKKLFLKNCALAQGYLIVTFFLFMGVKAFFGIFSSVPGFYITLGNTFILTYYTWFFKGLLVLLTLFSISLLSKWATIKSSPTLVWETPLVMLIGLVFMVGLVSTKNLFCLFLCIEGLSITLYVMLGVDTKKNSIKSIVTYYILSGLASILFLYGINRIYSMTSSLDYDDINLYFMTTSPQVISELAPALQLTLGCILFSLLFKLGLFPNYFWVRELYCSTSIPIIAYFALTVKVATFGALFRLYGNCFSELGLLWESLFLFSGAGSLIIGCLIALDSKSIHGFIAGSGINQAGIVLCSMSCAQQGGYTGGLLHLLVYSAALTGLLWLLCDLEKARGEPFQDLRNIYIPQRDRVFFILIVFSLAGVPFLAGFFSKYWVFFFIYKKGALVCLFVILSTSIISSYYYLRLIILALFTKADFTEQFNLSRLSTQIWLFLTESPVGCKNVITQVWLFLKAFWGAVLRYESSSFYKDVIFITKFFFFTLSNLFKDPRFYLGALNTFLTGFIFICSKSWEFCRVLQLDCVYPFYSSSPEVWGELLVIGG